MSLLKIVPLEERIVLDAAVGHDVAEAAASTATAGAHILVIPINTPDAGLLAQAAKDNVVVVLYDPSHSAQDLTHSIADALNGGKADSIAFVGDGAPGKFILSSTLTFVDSALQTNSSNPNMTAFWHDIGGMLKTNGHVDLISCDTAAGSVGVHLIESIQHSLNEIGTGITVYGSTDKTGSSSLGGDWILEAPKPLDAAALYFNQDALAGWNNVLHTVNTFNPVFSTTTTGDITFVSNTILQAPAGTTVDANTNNNDINMTYIDIDGNIATFNSSSADLALPNGSTVLFAGLYWGGGISNTDTSGVIDSSLIGQVLFKAPGDQSYQTITASKVDTLPLNSEINVDGFAYQSFADVTSLVQNAGTGTYTLADLQTSAIADGFGGWTMVVAFKDSTLAEHQMIVYDGFMNVDPGSASNGVNISGFSVPSTGDVSVQTGIVGYEGDAGLKGDFLRLDTQNAGNVKLSDNLNPANNFFNSTISTNGVYNSLKNPDFTNNLGMDAKIVDASTAFTNGQQTIDYTFGSGGHDSYYVGVITLSINTNHPTEANIVVSKSFTDMTPHNDGLVHAGDLITYTVTVANQGNDVAFDTLLTDVIPANTTYVPGTLTIVSGSVTGHQTDAIGDDLAQISGSTITFFLGDSAAPGEPGFLEAGSSTTITFQVHVNADTPDNTTISNTATVTYFKGETNIQSESSGSVVFTEHNDAPIANNDSFTVNEDTTLQVNAPSFLANDTDFEGQLSTFALVSGTTHGTLTINADGSFNYVPEANFFGQDSFSYKVFDAAHQASNTATVILNVNPVNDAPGFAVGPNQAVDQGTSHTVNGFITGISVGPPNESSQTIQFQVSTDNPSLFSQLPTIDATGNLSYTIAPNATGSALITVFAKDNGGTANGGIDTAGPQSFTINVNEVPPPPPPPPPTGTATPPPIPPSGGETSGSGNPPATPPTLFEGIGTTQPYIQEALPVSAEPAGIPGLHYEPTTFSEISSSTSAIEIARTPPSVISLTLQPYELERFEPTPYEHVITEASPPIFTETPTRAGYALVAAAAITDISYPGLNRRNEFAIPVRFAMSAVVVIPEAEPITHGGGGNLRLRVSLSSLPTTRVVVAFKSSNPDLAAVTPNELVFSPTNWNTEQYVTVIGKGGSAEGENYQILVMPAQSSDPNYNELETDPVNLIGRLD